MFENRLIVRISTCDSRYPGREWNRILPQTAITLNLLRSSRRSPSLSVYAVIVGEISFNVTPIATTGTKVLIHIKHNKRRTIGAYAIDGWYIVPSMDRYRFYSCYVYETLGVRNTDTVEFSLRRILFPTVNSNFHI